MPRILVLDDDEPLGQPLCDALTSEGHDVCLASHVPLALEMLDCAPVDLILTNVGRASGGEPDLSRLHLLRHKNPEAKIVVFTGHPHARRLDFDGLGIAA